MNHLTYNHLRDKKTLLLGSNEKRTRITVQILVQAIEENEGTITIIDFSPLKTTLNGIEVGGQLYAGTDRTVKILRSKLIKHTSLAQNAEELEKLSNYNKTVTDTILRKYTKSDILFINNVNVHLQKGNLQDLWTVIKKTKTIIINGHRDEHPSQDYETGIFSRERLLIRRLESKMNRVIKL